MVKSELKPWMYAFGFVWMLPLAAMIPTPAQGQSRSATGSTENVVVAKPGENENQTRLLRQLGADSYRVRQQAFVELWKASQSDASFDSALLDAAIESTDVEVAVMAKWLRTVSKLTSDPAEVSAMLKNLSLVRSGDIGTLVRLAEQSKWDQLERLLEAVQPDERARISEDTDATHADLAMLVELAWRSDQPARIPELVDLLWPANQAVYARLLWRDLGLNELAEHRRREKTLPANRAHETSEAVVELELKNEVTAAFELAYEAKNYEQAYSIALSAGRWDLALRATSELNKRGPEANRRFAPRVGGTRLRVQGLAMSGGPTITAGRNALLLEWSGDLDGAEGQAKSIPTPAEGKLDLAAGLTTRVLLGRIDEAIEIVKERDPDQAFETLVMQGKIHDAFAVYGWTDWSSEGVQKWLDQTLQNKPKTATDDLLATRRLVELACTLNRLGATELCEQVDNAVLYWLSGAGMDDASNGRQADRSLNEVVRDRWTIAFDTWNREHRRPYAFRQFEQLLRERIDDEQQNKILRVLDQPKANRISWGSLATRVFEWLQNQRASLADTNRSGESSKPTDDAQIKSVALRDFDDLAHNRPLKDWPVDWNRHGLRSLGQAFLLEAGDEDRSIVSRQLAKIALDLNRHDLVEEWLAVGAGKKFAACYAQIAKTTTLFQPLDLELDGNEDDLARLEMLGRSLAARREYRLAGLAFGVLWQHQPERLDLALQHADCLQACGAVSEAEQVRRRAMSFPMFSAYVPEFAAELERIERYEDAGLLLKHALRIAERDMSSDWPLCYRLRLVESSLRGKKLPSDQPLTAEAIPILQNALYTQRRECLSRLDAFPAQKFELQWDVVAYELLWRSQAALAIAEGNFEQADQAIRSCHRAWPEQIETPLELIPWARAKFGPERVQAWLEIYAEPMELHMSRWPNDTLIGNNLAWLYAKLDWKLERAEELSRRVCNRLPNDDVYLDTLAEIEFRRGHQAEAVELAARCREIAPLETHHRAQLKRFRAAK